MKVRHPHALLAFPTSPCLLCAAAAPSVEGVTMPPFSGGTCIVTGRNLGADVAALRVFVSSVPVAPEVQTLGGLTAASGNAGGATCSSACGSVVPGSDVWFLVPHKRFAVM